MKPINEILQKAFTELQPFSSTPQLDAEILLQFTLNYSKEQLFLAHYENIQKDKIDLFFQLIKKRKLNTPIAQLIGIKHFWKSKFIVSKDTLTPRPETEILIEAFLKKVPNKNKNFSIIDFGTGTGCIIISILQEYKNAFGYAFEINKKTYEIAKQNILNHNLTSKIKLINQNWNSCTINEVDYIVNNPPYIKTEDINTLANDIKYYEPRIALNGGKNGLDCYIEIFQIVKKILKKNGLLFLEIGINQFMELENIAKSYDLQKINIFKDLANITRCLVFQKKY